MARRGANTNEGIKLVDELEGYSTGYGLIDMISGVPGMLFPKATLVEVYGAKSSSKTTLVLETIAFNQMIDPNFRVLYADFEKMIRNQTSYLKKLGVDTETENFVCITPDTMEEGCAQILDYVRNDNFNMIVVDTVAAMRPKIELEKGFAENKQIGVRGKLMSEFLRNLMADLPEDGPAVVFINQMFQDISNTSFIPLNITPASKSLEYYAGIRIEVRESTKMKDKRINPYTLEESDIPYGSIIVIKTVKNKVGKPFLESKYMITYGKGIDIVPSVIAAAQRANVIRNKGKSKSSFLYTGADGTEKSAVGMSKLIAKFKENPDDLIAVGSAINELWAEDLKLYKQRLERKSLLEDDLDSMYVLEDEDEDGEALEIEENIPSPDFNGEEAKVDVETLDLSSALTASETKPVVKRSTKSGGMKLKI